MRTSLVALIAKCVTPPARSFAFSSPSSSSGARVFSSQPVRPAGAIAVELVRGGPRAAAAKAAPSSGAVPTRAAPPTGAPAPVKEALSPKCGTLPEADDDFSDGVDVVDPVTGERGGPTRAGTRPEPTRFGDYEIKGRCTDF